MQQQQEMQREEGRADPREDGASVSDHEPSIRGAEQELRRRC